MNELIKIETNSDNPTVLGRDLHAALGVETPYRIWFPRMAEYGFSDGVDYLTVNNSVRRADGTEMPQTQTDHQLTIEMAKELCMLQRTDKGKECRQYFIEIERRWNEPASVMARALQMAQKQISSLQSVTAALLPKGEYYDALVDRNMLTSFRDTAKLIGIGERAFIFALLDDKFIYRDLAGRLAPYAEKNSGYFAVKEFTRCEHAGLQTLVTMKGREYFSKRYGGAHERA